MGIAERNLEALKARRPELVGNVKCGAPTGWRAQPAADGRMTAVYEGAAGDRYIHSRIDPGADAAEWARDIPGTSGSMIVLGFGLGYHVIELMRDARFAPVMVIESSPSLFGLALNHIDLEKILLHPDLLLVIGEDGAAVREHLYPLRAQPFAFRPYHPVTCLNPSYYDPIRDFLENSLRRLRSRTDPALSAGVRTLMEALAE
jgi:hypothetical protein